MITLRTLLSDGIIIKNTTTDESNTALNSKITDTPVISVIMPTYCRGKTTLRRAIDSVLNQTFMDFELIIVDDGSRDGTFDILKEYQKKDSRMVIVRHEYNSGLPAARVNEAILIAKGKYIAYQFDDDEWVPDALETLYNEIIKYKEPCAVYGTCEGVVKQVDGSTRNVSFGRPFNYGLLVNGNYIANNSVLHPKDIFEHCGMYDPHVLIRRFSDYDLWLRMAKAIRLIWIDKTVSKVHAGEKHSLAEEEGIAIKNLIKIRKYVEISREEILQPQKILDYEIDDINQYNNYFRQEEIDFLNRNEIIPFRSRTTYYLKKEQIGIGNISRPKLRHIALTKADYSTSVDVTIRNFTNRINEFPYKYFFIKEGDISLLEKNDYDLLVLYRTISKYSSDLLNATKSLEKPSIYFMDDNMFKFHELGDQFSYLKPETSYYKNLEYQIANCDMIASYSRIITDDCKDYNKKIVELSTNISSKYLVYKEAVKNENITRIGIFTGESRKKEIKELFPVLEELSKEYSDKIEIHFWGINPDDYGKLHCKIYYKEFTHSYEQYLNDIKENYFDFTLCPLEGIFDATKSKSPIKLLEGTAAGSVLIFSDVLPYSLLPDDICIKTGNSSEEWLSVLRRAVSMTKDERTSIYNKAFNYIYNNYITENQANKLLSVFEAAQLHHKLKDRSIAYFFHESYLGGATIHLFKHACYMKELGFNVLLCLPDTQVNIPDLNEKANDKGLMIHYLKLNRFLEVVNDNNAIAHSEEITKWFESKNVGLVHSLTYMPAVGVACKKLNIPHVATLHNYYSCRLTKDEIRSNKLIDYVHSSSNIYASEWNKCLEVPSRRICCAVEQEYYDCFENNIERLSNQPETINILLSGTVQPRKNQLEAIKAVKLLKDRGYKVNMNIIGYSHLKKDYVKECDSYINDNNLQNEVKILGFEKNPLKYYKSCSDILLCCSLEESMPQTILQALAAGVMVATTEVGGVREIIKNNYSGILFQGTDEVSIAAGLERAIELLKKDSAFVLKNAHNCSKMISHPDFVKNELINLYNEAYDLKVTK